MPGKTSPTTVIKEPPICTTSLTFHWPKPAEQLWYVKTYRRLNELQSQTLDNPGTQADAHMSLPQIQKWTRAQNGIDNPTKTTKQPTDDSYDEHNLNRAV